jgi:hypothetical protein
LRREGSILFLGGDLPAREALETVFDSLSQASARLIRITFGSEGGFSGGEELTRLVKRNFDTPILGSFAFTPSFTIVDRSYAAGIDLVDIPAELFQGVDGQKYYGDLLAHARTVFPRWATTTTLIAGEEPAVTTMTRIDQLLGEGILPFVRLSDLTPDSEVEDMIRIYAHLVSAWRSNRAGEGPLHPLIEFVTPLVIPRRGVVGTFMDRLNSTRFRASSELRRHLRVQGAADSFDSAGL